MTSLEIGIPAFPQPHMLTLDMEATEEEPPTDEEENDWARGVEFTEDEMDLSPELRRKAVELGHQLAYEHINDDCAHWCRIGALRYPRFTSPECLQDNPSDDEDTAQERDWQQYCWRSLVMRVAETDVDDARESRGEI